MNYKEMFRRNIGFLTEEDQKKVSQLSVGIAGAGGDGGLLADAWVIFFAKGEGNEKIVCGIGGNISFGGDGL